MRQIQTNRLLDGLSLVRLVSDYLAVEIVPDLGGRVVSLVHFASGHQFLWRNAALRLERLPAGSEYDPHFYGGIDELLPNDIPECIQDVVCPDHGELWTMPLKWEINGEHLCLSTRLPKFGLDYQRILSLREDGPWIDCSYRITNTTATVRPFLWKLHAALNIQVGDIIDCPARQAQVVDLAWSRHDTLEPFAWPRFGPQSVNVIPPQDGTVEFYYLYGLTAGQMAWRRPAQGLCFCYHFDLSIFPYAWLFASYGGFNGHYTVILEPCTAMPISVNAAADRGQCSRLEPGATLETRVSIYAGQDPR